MPRIGTGMSAKVRLLTWIGFQHSALRRRIDRVEARSRCALFLVFVIAALPAMWSVGEAVNQAGAHQERVQQSDQHQVSARLLEDAPAAVSSTIAVRIPVVAEWTEPDGSSHRGIIKVAPGSPAGSLHTIWTNTSGNPVPAPLSREDRLASAAGAAFLTFVLIGTVPLGIGLLLHRRFDRQRLEQWEREWQQVGPAWSRHR